jgi:hypothetical protein
MSLNYKEGKPIVTLGKKTIYVEEKPGETTSIKLTGKDEFFLPAIDKKTEREILFVAAASGSGKSYWTRKYIDQYHKAYPKRKVYVFSSLEEDPTLDALKYLKRIKIKDPEFLRTEFEIKDFKDCLVIYDDTDAITNKKIQGQLTAILDLILDTGRHTNTSLAYTSHLLYAGHKTKHILSEAHTYVVYPLTSSKKHLEYLLSTYLGFDKDQIKRLISLEGRAKVIRKTYPIVVWGDKEIYVRND